MSSLLRLFLGVLLCGGAAVRLTAADNSSLTGGVYCGYQGWFNAPGDGSERGFRHYGKDGEFAPGRCSVEFWPDMSEATESEKFATPFRFADGSPAYVYSARHPETVSRHFRWMREYGIRGAMLQRFLTEIRDPSGRENADTVLANVRRAASLHDRTWMLMYDISGNADFELFARDWKRLIDTGVIRRDDPTCQHHAGKPLVAFWGLFAERPESPGWFERAIDLVTSDPVYGGFAVMAGVNDNWRTIPGESGERIRRIVSRCAVVSPWTVGRYDNETREEWMNRVIPEDMKWCEERGITYFPVIFPGFSWHNLHGGKFDQIPRREGRFYREQAETLLEFGARQLYVAMFDEMDEGTCIFKTSSEVPAGESPFLTYGEGVPPDFYLRLTSWIARQLNRESAVGRQIHGPEDRQNSPRISRSRYDHQNPGSDAP